MTTEQTAPTTTVKAGDLARILDQVHAHQSTNELAPAICGVHLDSDRQTLHAVASDRYSLAVARTDLIAPGATWAHTIPSSAVKMLRRWSATESQDAQITIAPSTDKGSTTVSFGSDTSILAFHAVDADFPKWRSLIFGALDKKPTGDVVGLDTDYAARWQKAERNLRTWATGPRSAVLFAGDDFLGLQMPTRPHGDNDWQHDEITAAWKVSLGAHEVGADDPVDPAQFLDGVDTGAQRREFTKRLLWRTITGSEELNGIGIDDPRFHDLVNTHVYAWSTYRLMRALTVVAPAFTEKTLAELDDELQGGEFTELAWDYAQEAGHDPDAWIAEYHAAKAARAAKQTEQAAVEPEFSE